MELQVNNFNAVTQSDTRSETQSWSLESLLQPYQHERK